MDALSEKKIEWLREYRALEMECLRLQEEIGRWRSAAERTTRALSALPGGPSGESVVEKAVDEIGGLELELIRKLRQKTARRREIERAIDAVKEERLCHLLRLRYVEGLKWCRVAETMYYSDMQVMRLHREAVALVQVPKDALGGADGAAA